MDTDAEEGSTTGMETDATNHEQVEIINMALVVEQDALAVRFMGGEQRHCVALSCLSLLSCFVSTQTLSL